MNWGNAIVAVAGFTIIGVTVWISLASRRKGISNWWAWLVGLPIVFWIAFSAAVGHPVRTR